MSKAIEYERKWVSGRDRLLDYLSSQLEKGGSWDFRIEEDDIVSDGYYVTSTPIGDWTTVQSPWGEIDMPVVEAGRDGCFHNSAEAYYIWQSSRSGDCQ